jgi:hypothetical protein
VLKINLPVSLEFFKRLEPYASASQETWDAVLAPLLDRVEAQALKSISALATAAPPASQAPPKKMVLFFRPPGPKTMFKTSRGTELPIGLDMLADYRGNHIAARVTERGFMYHGKTYDDPSAAAVAAKIDCGVSRDAAQTNGWLFWNYRTAEGRTAAINKFRDSPESALAEYQALKKREALGVNEDGFPEI